MAKRITATIHVSYSELVDRVTILQIKAQRSGHTVSAHLDVRLREYLDELTRLNVQHRISDLHRFLARINGMLWRLENKIRRYEAKRQFGPPFICTARMIFRLNDCRSAIKTRIDEMCQSEFRDTKSYS